MAEEAKKESGKKAKNRTPSAKKRDLQSFKKQVRNNSFKATVRTAIRAFEKAVEEGNKAVMIQKLNTVYSLLDKGVKTNKFKLNKAARTKSRLTHRVPA